MCFLRFFLFARLSWVYGSYCYQCDLERNFMLGLDDSNIWGFLAVPVGVAVCFGPALFVWIREEYFAKSKDQGGSGL